MKDDETLIEMARRHVAEGERHVQTQRRIIERLDRDELPAGMARDLLSEFEGTLADHRASLARLEDEQRTGYRDASGNPRWGGG